jgi:hypothetical protein
MARYQHLPVYRITYELLLKVTVATKEFPREYKFTIGQKLQDEVVGLVVLIYKANAATTERHLNIKLLLEHLQVVELLIRLSQDMRILSKKHYAALIEMTQSVAKQAEGWKKSTSKIST